MPFLNLLAIRGVGVPFPKNGNPFSRVLAFLRTANSLGFLAPDAPKSGFLKLGTHSRVCVPGFQGTGTQTWYPYCLVLLALFSILKDWLREWIDFFNNVQFRRSFLWSIMILVAFLVFSLTWFNLTIFVSLVHQSKGEWLGTLWTLLVYSKERNTTISWKFQYYIQKTMNDKLS